MMEDELRRYLQQRSISEATIRVMETDKVSMKRCACVRACVCVYSRVQIIFHFVTLHNNAREIMIRY